MIKKLFVGYSILILPVAIWAIITSTNGFPLWLNASIGALLYIGWLGAGGWLVHWHGKVSEKVRDTHYS